VLVERSTAQACLRVRNRAPPRHRTSVTAVSVSSILTLHGFSCCVAGPINANEISRCSTKDLQVRRYARLSRPVFRFGTTHCRYRRTGQFNADRSTRSVTVTRCTTVLIMILDPSHRPWGLW
jgi:hypothetical protein